jgi:hypothetical protein
MAVLGTAYGDLKIGKNGGKLLKSQVPSRAVKLLLLLMMMITKIGADMTKLNNISCNVTPCGMV